MIIANQLNNNFLTTIDLPVKISGMYPIYVENKLIANISSNENKWMLQVANEFKLSESSINIKPFEIYTINSKLENENFKFIVIPKYDPTAQVFNFNNALTIGNSSNCDIYYSYDQKANNQEIINIVPVKDQNYWLIETNSNNIFISGRRARSGEKIFNGDYIFYYG